MATPEGPGQSTGDSVRQIVDQVSFNIKRNCMAICIYYTLYAYKV